MNNFEKLFNPKSIAVIGATDKKEKVGYAIFKNIIDGGFKGRVYPVNKRLKYLEGYKVYPSVLEIPDQIDLAIIAIPIVYVPQIFDQLGKKGVKAAVVVSAGGKEAGEEGRKIEQTIKQKADSYGIRFLGPNCLGFTNTLIDLNANFGLDKPLKGKTAFISQSGALFTAIMDWALQERIGFSYAVSIGNMADVDFGDLIRYLGDKNEVETILIYMESLSDPEKFAKACRDVTIKKPVVIAKAGKSETGQKAAVSHTGAIAGKDFLYTALFKRVGALRVESVLQLFDMTEALSKKPIPEGSRFAVVTNAGGPGVMAADQFDRWHTQPAKLSKETIEKLNRILPPVWSHNNPVDIIGDAPPERYMETLDILFDAPEVDGIICILTPQFMTKPFESAQVFYEVSKDKKKPFYSVLLGGEKLQKARRYLEEHDIPVFETPEEAVDSMFMAWRYRYCTDLVRKDNIPPKPERKAEIDEFIKSKIKQNQLLLTELDVKKILKAYSIPVNPTFNAKTKEEAVKIAQEIGYPVVMKINSPDILHKSDAGCVILNVSNSRQVEEAYDTITQNARSYKKDATIEGIIVEKQVKGDFELIIGSSYDSLFSQYIMFGMGGTMVEFFKDVSFDFIPLSESFAKEMVSSTKIYKILKEGFRNKKPVEIKKVVNILMNVSNLLQSHPEIKELDINPVVVKENQVWAVDGRIKLSLEKGKNTILV
ncbi:acetate--CoA ligase family protein [Persephonella sp.]|uniref:acetate--CoA ligase family protein n=1 Tax=Persephonella sp. TaxID=2060922 RepID=UPI0025FAFAF5|nr:acetate--CoA ligase family protein [Persephonella sp.]